jgi:predicted Zn-dependent protease
LAQQKRNDEAIAEWNQYLDLKGQQDPKEADIVRKHIKELGGTPH